ncbi:hypothetical protein [Nannocystis pusilla]|uniref:hypothetical protein n=1 Tax=Nannocystis pusilla TaxID=889268 RepID=UPI003B7FF3DD
MYFRFGLGNRSISNERLRNLIRQSEDESLMVAEIDRAAESEAQSPGSRMNSLIQRTLDQEFSPVFGHAFLKALLIRSNTILRSGDDLARWIVPIYRDALRRLVAEAGQVRSLVDAALACGQVSGVMQLLWMLDNPDEFDKKWEQMGDSDWIETKISEWLTGASVAELIALPPSYLEHAIPLWAKKASWNAVGAKFQDTFADPLALASLLAGLDARSVMRRARVFANAQSEDVLQRLFNHDAGLAGLRDLANADPPHSPGSEDAANCSDSSNLLARMNCWMTL